MEKSIDKNVGIKHDEGKEPMSLLSTLWLKGVSAVLAFGAKKYASHNWRKGISYSRLTDAALRHITAFNDGEDLDPETKLNHLLHASCCLMFLYELHERQPVDGDKGYLDDRFKYKNVSDPIITKVDTKQFGSMGVSHLRDVLPRIQAKIEREVSSQMELFHDDKALVVCDCPSCFRLRNGFPEEAHLSRHEY